MRVLRVAIVLVVVQALLTGAAAAAGPSISQLTPNPPVSLPQSSGGPSSPGTSPAQPSSPASSPGQGSRLPHTGLDLLAVLLAGGVIAGAGVVLRLPLQRGAHRFRA